jgi:hypothetical protein
MLDRRVASQMSVVAERTELERIEVHATMYRGPKYEIDLQYQLLWEEPEPTLLLPGPAPLAMWPGERQVHLICYVPSVAGPREYFPIAQNLFYSMTAPTVLTTAPAVPAVAAMALATAAPGRLIGPYLSPAARILTLTGSISAPRMQPPSASLGLASDVPTAFVLSAGLTMPTLVITSPQFSLG